MNTWIDLNSLHNMRTEWGVEHADTDDITGALYGAVRSCVSWSDTNQWNVFLSRMQHARPDLFCAFSSDDIVEFAAQRLYWGKVTVGWVDEASDLTQLDIDCDCGYTVWSSNHA